MASTSLLSIIFALMLCLFAILFPRQKSEADSALEVGIWRRFGAFLIDFFAILTIATPLLTLPIILAEYYQTGTLVWSFQRDFSRPTDNTIIIPSALSVFFFMWFYFYENQVKERTTLGQYISGYRISGKNGSIKKRDATTRVLLSFVGMCIWPISVLHVLYNEKVFWWDEFSNTRVERMKSLLKNVGEHSTSSPDLP